MTVDLEADSERLYEGAMSRRQRILERWEELDRPLTAPGSKGQLVPHPLMTMLREHDMLCTQLAAPLRKRHRGPLPSAVPSIRRPKSSSLRAAR